MNKMQMYIKETAVRFKQHEPDLRHAERSLHFQDKGMYRDAKWHSQQIKWPSGHLWAAAEQCVDYRKELVDEGRASV